jgi:hypothetical protein
MENTMIIKTEIDTTDIAISLASSDADTQSKLIKEFFIHLKKCCETKYYTDVQIMAITENLDGDTIEMLQQIIDSYNDTLSAD